MHLELWKLFLLLVCAALVAAQADPAHYSPQKKCPRSCNKNDYWSPQLYCDKCQGCSDYWQARCGGATGCAGLPAPVANAAWPTSCKGSKPGSTCKAVCTKGYFGDVSAKCRVLVPPRYGYGVHTASKYLPQRPKASWSQPEGSCRKSLGGTENGDGTPTLPPTWGGNGVGNNAAVAGGTVKVVNNCNMPLLAIFTINTTLAGWDTKPDWRFLNIASGGNNVWTKDTSALQAGWGYVIKAWPLPVFNCSSQGCDWTCPACGKWSQRKGGPLSKSTNLTDEANRRYGWMWTGDGPSQWNYDNLQQYVPHCNPQQVENDWPDRTLCAPWYLTSGQSPSVLYSYGTLFEATFNNADTQNDNPDLSTNYGFNATSPCTGTVPNYNAVAPGMPILFNLPIKWQTNYPCNVPKDYPPSNGGTTFPCTTASCDQAYKCPVPQGTETDKQISCATRAGDRGYVVTFCPDGHTIYDPTGRWP